MYTLLRLIILRRVYAMPFQSKRPALLNQIKYLGRRNTHDIPVQL